MDVNEACQGEPSVVLVVEMGWMTHISSQHISSSSLFLPPHQNELSSPIPVDLFHQLSSSQHKIGARLYWELSHSAFVESLKMKGFSKQTSSLSLRFFFGNILRVPISTSNDLEVALKLMLPKLTAQFTSRFAPSPHYLIKLKNGHIRAAVMQKKSSKLSEFHR